jgi:DNA-binding PadR family transcriptional regulator
MGVGECDRLLDRLHQNYLIDVVSQLDGDKVRQSLRLTEEGERVLLLTLEKMCELPEA